MDGSGKNFVSDEMEPGVGLLLGRHDYTLDPKRRFTIPREWRSIIGDVIYVMPDREERCLNLYSQAEMESFLAQLRQKALLDSALNRVYAKLGAVSQQLTLDTQGRIRICDKLLNYANVRSKVAIVGAMRLLKVYDPEVIGPEDQVDIDDLDGLLTEAGM